MILRKRWEELSIMVEEYIKLTNKSKGSGNLKENEILKVKRAKKINITAK